MSGALSSPHAVLDFNRSLRGNRLKWQEHSAKRGRHSTGLNQVLSFAQTRAGSRSVSKTQSRPSPRIAIGLARHQAPLGGKSSLPRLSALWSALIRSRATTQAFARVPKAAAPLKAPIGVSVLDDDLDAGARLEPLF